MYNSAVDWQPKIGGLGEKKCSAGTKCSEKYIAQRSTFSAFSARWSVGPERISQSSIVSVVAHESWLLVPTTSQTRPLATASIFFFRPGWEWTSHSVAPFTKWTNHSWEKRNKQFPFDWKVHLSVRFTIKANILFPLFQISGFHNQWWTGVGRACFCPYGFLYTMGEFKKKKQIVLCRMTRINSNWISLRRCALTERFPRRAKTLFIFEQRLNVLWLRCPTEHSNPRPRPLCSLLKRGQVGNIVLGVTERLWSL